MIPHRDAANPGAASLPANALARVALVNMPFAMADRPSIQCGLLKSALRAAGHEAHVYYLNLELAAELSESFYREMAQLRTDLLLGEWLFSEAAFGNRTSELAYREAAGATLQKILSDLGIDFARLCELRKEVLPTWIRDWATRVDWGQYLAVGFTSTFEQNTAALALAREIKECHPKVPLLFGGANFDGEMGKEYARALPFVDYVVSGEGDFVLPQIVRCLLDGEDPLKIAGVSGRRDGLLISNGPAPKVREMDKLPDPDYDEYFATLFRLGREKVLGNQPPLLLFEASRGCWWGEKQHCTFCGLNNNGMQFRSKPARRVLDELNRLASRYKIVSFEAVDNIMDHKYLEELCLPLAEEHLDYRLFFEVKANLSPAQLRAMARAGITSIQPGIESINSHILQLMRKGVTMIRNVRLLKWAHYYGMRVGWNILTGFPGETEDDYRDQLRVLPLLRHLPPPDGFGRIWMERFSPYFFDESFPVHSLRPLDIYRFVYPESELDLREIAYFFSYEMESTLPEDFHGQLREVIEEWKSAWKSRARPALMYQRAPNWIQIVDRRDAEPKVHSFEGVAAAVYEICGECERTPDAVQLAMAGSNGGSSAKDQIQCAVEEFCSLGLMIEEKGRFLSLALPVNRHW